MTVPAWVEIINQPHISKAVSPRRWGSGGWTLLDSIGFSYPLHPTPDDKQKVANFYHAFKHVLPCSSCRRDFMAMLDEDPIENHLYSREALTRWLNKVHNHVNAKLGKPYFAYEDYVAKFAKTTGPHDYPSVPGHFSAQVSTSNKPVIKGALVLLGLLLAGGLLFWFFNKKR